MIKDNFIYIKKIITIIYSMFKIIKININNKNNKKVIGEL